MYAHNVVEGWEVFERWAKRFQKVALNNPNYAYCLSTANDVTRLFEETNISYLDIESIEYPDFGEKLIQDRISFLRDYLVDISFDGGDFHQIVKSILDYQDPRRCKAGYTIWTRPHDYGNIAKSAGIHFHGFDATLFFEDYQDCEFGTTMSIAPFENIFVRNKRGEDWTDQDANIFIKHLKYDLEFDGYQNKIARYYVGKKFHHGPLLCAMVKVA